MNRRLAMLVAAAAVALVTGVAVGADDPAPSKTTKTAQASPTATAPDAPKAPEDPDLAAVRKLSLYKLAGATVIMRFAGSPEPAYVRDALKAGRAAGVILFRDNMPSAGPTQAMTRRLQRAGHHKAIISTDQEGGSIRNLPWVAPSAAQSTISTTAAARSTANAAGKGLKANGINVNLAPIGDIGGPGPVMRGRAFPGNTAQVARLTGAAVRGYRGTKVAPTVKHFPGLGAATANTDDAAVTIPRAANVIGSADLPPFRAAIAAGVPLVMLSHAVYPALDRNAIASQSRKIVNGLLKERLGFEGVAVTDSIEAQAVRSRMGPEQAAIRSMRAGVDLILTTGPGSHLRVWRALRAEARKDPKFRARLVQAAARVQALRRSVTP